MKGMAVDVATTAIIALVIAVIVLVIFNASSISLIFTGKQLEGLFEPNKFTACALDKAGTTCVTGAKISEVNVALDCSIRFSNTYVVELTNVQFRYKGTGDNRQGRSFEFLTVLDHGDQLTMGMYGTTPVLTCNKEGDSDMYECTKFTKDNPLKFTVTNVQGSRLLLHITAWKNEPIIKNTVQNSPPNSFASLVDEAYPFYMASVDIPIKIFDLLQACPSGGGAPQCSDYDTDPNTCNSINGCYWENLGAIAPVGVCQTCEQKSFCILFGSEEACTACASSSGLSCSWTNSNGCQQI